MQIKAGTEGDVPCMSADYLGDYWADIPLGVKAADNAGEIFICLLPIL